MDNQKIINVTDLSKYLYCPRQLYLEKIIGIKKPITKEMVEGRIIHEVLENFSNYEKEFISEIEESIGLESSYFNFLSAIINKILLKNQESINLFLIDRKKIIERINIRMKKDIDLRIKSIKEALEKNFKKQELLENLQPKYFSEFFIVSESLGLRGKIDRLVFNKKNIEIFELKTREVSKVYESDEIQLIAYALLVEEEFNQKINHCFLEAGNQIFQIDVDDIKKRKVISLINEIQNNLSKRYPSNFSKCEKCSYKEECNKLD